MPQTQRKSRRAAALHCWTSDLTMMAAERAASWTPPSSGADKRYSSSRERRICTRGAATAEHMHSQNFAAILTM